MEVVALCQHLRADKNVQRSTGKGTKRFLKLAFGSRSVAVEARDARTGKVFAQPFFEMLGAFTKEIDVFRLALRALLRNLLNRRSEEHTSELQSPCNLVC